MPKEFKKLYSPRRVFLLAVILSLITIAISFYYKIHIEINFQKQTENNLHQIASQTTDFIESELLQKGQILNYISNDLMTSLSYPAPVKKVQKNIAQPKTKGKKVKRKKTNVLKKQKSTNRKQSAKKAEETDQNKNVLPKAIVKKLTKIAEQYNFNSIGITDDSGTGFTESGLTVNFNDNEDYKLAKNTGKSCISNIITREKNQHRLITYFVPFESQNKPKHSFVLFATLKIDDIKDNIPTFLYTQKAYFYLIDRDGEILATSAPQVQGYAAPKNLFDTLYESELNQRPDIDETAKNIKEGKVGYVKFKYKTNKYFYYYPVKINNWYVVSAVPINQIEALKRNTETQSLFLLLTVTISSLAFLLIVLYILTKSEKELSNAAYIDPLTGGISFTKFHVYMKKALKKNLKKTKMALISININKFRAYTNCIGKEEGDNLLKFVWNTIENRRTEQELHVRLAADQFYFLACFNSESMLIDRLSIIYDIIRNYNSESKNRYYIKTSFGIYVIPSNPPDTYKIIEYANYALENTRKRHTDFYSFFDSYTYAEFSKHIEIEKGMFKAMKNNEFQIYYRPMFDINTKTIVSAEAFAKWIKPDGTEIPEEVFRPIFEKNFFITSLNKYTFARVCKQQKIWMQSNIKSVPISVNMSKLNFYDINFINIFKKIISEYGIKINLVFVEISDSIFMEDINMGRLYRHLNELNDEGFSLHLKVVDSGYSSLEVLKNISINALKFNKQFIEDIEDKSKSRKIISNIIELAHSLNIKVICEDVDTEEQYNFLKKAGCDIAQGAYFSKILSSTELEKMLIAKNGYNLI